MIILVNDYTEHIRFYNLKILIVNFYLTLQLSLKIDNFSGQEHILVPNILIPRDYNYFSGLTKIKKWFVSLTIKCFHKGIILIGVKIEYT